MKRVALLLALAVGCAHQPSASRFGEDPLISELHEPAGVGPGLMPAYVRATRGLLLALDDNQPDRTISIPLTLTQTLTSTVAATTNAFVQPTNTYHCFDGPTCTRRIYWDTVSVKMSGGNFQFDNGASFTSGVSLNTGARLIYGSQCDSTASPGAATCPQAAGRAAIAAAAASVVITDTLATTTSIIIAQLQASDGTCTSVKSVVPASGSFTINVNAACTGNTNVAWELH